MITSTKESLIHLNLIQCSTEHDKTIIILSIQHTMLKWPKTIHHQANGYKTPNYSRADP